MYIYIYYISVSISISIYIYIYIYAKFIYAKFSIIFILSLSLNKLTMQIQSDNQLIFSEKLDNQTVLLIKITFAFVKNNLELVYEI